MGLCEALANQLYDGGGTCSEYAGFKECITFMTSPACRSPVARALAYRAQGPIEAPDRNPASGTGDCIC